MRILVVEDEKEISESLARRLRADKYEVDVALDGEKGLFLARTNDYILMILDYNLPKRDGRQICKIIRKEGIDLPIIMLTVESGLEDKVGMMDLGVDDYITKPFSFDELMARIRSLLRRPKHIEREIITVGDLIINKSIFKVKRKNKEISLTRKEFMLLVYLAKNKNCVISSEVILEHVWDMNVDLFSHTVKTHIMNLRRKIDGGFKTKLIHTVICRGYMVAAKK
ncbi:response regulator transcription factor [Candidatus Parcubacteria bacterium]|nr:response regulator transcription factor [Candidatus Parcubacteria bacterium]